MSITDMMAQTNNDTRPNILVIMLDDARYDMFKPNGGPEFFNTPAISRIAEEGVNFRYSCATTALCTPSRASVYSGLYAHNHGALTNEQSPVPGLKYVSSILQEAGYTTGFVGKWLLKELPDTPIGFNYWALSKKSKHYNPLMQFNDGTTVSYEGHDAEIFTDLAVDFLNNQTSSEEPWLLFVCHQVPHTPFGPRDEDEGLYQSVDIEFPENFARYQKNYPSYLYPDHEFKDDSTALDQSIRDYYETCHAAEYSTDSLLSYLDIHEMIDSTLIIFMSDNGHLKGEHALDKKIIAYEESLRVPLFIRYPAWFQAGTVVEDAIGANIDIAPTILDAAGISDTFNMDGVSLRKLANGTEQRKFFFFENYGPGDIALEAVRSLEYKYIYSYCNSTTEEFFDLTNDPQENINLIFDPGYAILIQKFRNKREQLRVATGDTIHPVEGNCFLGSDFYADTDGDGYGNPNIYILDTIAPAGYVSNNTDCDDSPGGSGINPGASDNCNGIDDNCDTQIDENIISASITPDSTVIVCKGNQVTLTANSGSGISFQWLKNSSVISGATDQIYTTKEKGNYTVLESNSFNCNATSPTTTITTLAKPPATITPLGDLDICLAGSVVLMANSGTDFTYQWKKGSGAISGATNQTYTATSAATYKVTVTDNNGCLNKSAGITVIKSCKNEYLSHHFDSKLSIYPNPAGGKFIIDLKLKEESEIAAIEVLSVVGQIMYSREEMVIDGTMKLEITPNHSFAEGVYIIKVAVKEKTYYGQLVYQR